MQTGQAVQTKTPAQNEGSSKLSTEERVGRLFHNVRPKAVYVFAPRCGINKDGFFFQSATDEAEAAKMARENWGDGLVCKGTMDYFNQYILMNDHVDLVRLLI